VLVFIGLVVLGSVASVWLPQSLTWNIMRFSVAVVCLVPFWLSLRRLQRG
jgi:hypothetical protein